jgi:hypothetical protein
MNSAPATTSEVTAESAVGANERWRTGQAQYVRRARQVAYWSHLFDDFTHSPGEFYALIEQQLDQRAVPDRVSDCVLLREGTVFSKERLYLELRRERFVFQICAAPFGSGWFVSSRLFDRRRGARWWDFLIICSLVSGLSLGLWLQFGSLVTVAILGIVFTLAWSLMRLASNESLGRLDDWLCRVPFAGRLYETFFHPDTFFRQDQCNMFRAAVHRALLATLTNLGTQKGLKPLSEAESRPLLTELQPR